MTLHKLYYGGDERLPTAHAINQKTSADGKFVMTKHDTGASMHFPAGNVQPNVNYRHAAENGGRVGGRPYERNIAPADWFADTEEGVHTPWDTGLGEYLTNFKPAAGDVLQLAFIPRGSSISWVELQTHKVFAGVTGDLVWRKNISGANTSQVLAANVDLGVADSTGKIAIAAADGDAGDFSDNFLEFVVTTLPTDDDWFGGWFTLWYDMTHVRDA